MAPLRAHGATAEPAGERLRVTARVTGAAVVLTGAGVFLAWPLEWTTVRSVHRGWVAMKPVTALALAALGVAAGLLARDRRRHRRPWADRLAATLGAVVLAVGVATLAEYAAGMRTGFERLFGPGDATGPRMAPTTAAGLALAGLAVALVRRRPRLAQVVLLAGGLPAYVAVLGYAARTESFYRFGAEVGMAAHTAVALVLVCLAGLAVVPGGTLARIEAGGDAASVVLRAAVPATVALPPVVAGAVTVLANAGVVADGLRLAVTVAVLVVVHASLLVHLALRLRSVEAERDATWVLAERDPATGIANRRAFERAVREWERRGAGSPASVLVVDLDDFKHVNDTFGHLAGDRVLAGFARALSGAMRDGDLVARLGGDEFVVLLPDAGADVAVAAARRVVRVAAAVAGSLPEARGLGVSVGVGAAEDGDPSLARTLERADRAVYRAKAGGKNRVSVWVDGPGDADATRPSPAATSAVPGRRAPG